MRASMILVLMAGVASLAPAGGFADGGMPITLINDNPDAVMVTVYDENASPPAAVLSSRQINGFAAIPLLITPGPDGTGHIAWNAVSADSFVGLCGHRDRPQLAANTEVHVYAKSNCHAPQ